MTHMVRNGMEMAVSLTNYIDFVLFNSRLKVYADQQFLNFNDFQKQNKTWIYLYEYCIHKQF